MRKASVKDSFAQHCGHTTKGRLQSFRRSPLFLSFVRLLRFTRLTWCRRLFAFLYLSFLSIQR